MTNLMNHSFHIPVLGIGFSVDAPVKVAKYGISSVLSIVDDTLLEKLRGYYLQKQGNPYVPINDGDEDCRASRITEYLNVINQIVNQQFDDMKKSGFSEGSELCKYFDMLPDFSELKKKYLEMKETASPADVKKMQDWLLKNMKPGSIDVNIMTKVDKTNFDKKGQALPPEYSDAQTALRGYANSDLESSVVFSAGMNPRLYGYAESFEDFYPDAEGKLKKKIIIKVSDFRSALIQGKFLAKKGLWVSEYRIESGLNCGGHAFATDGFLLGPILEEFRSKRADLVDSVKKLYIRALDKKNIPTATVNPDVDVTVQGGVGTAAEQDFFIRRYGVTSVGWGSPFLLVPEVMNVDDETLAKLKDAGEKDIYLSGVSPLGVPFNNLRGNQKDKEKNEHIKEGKPGSPCTKKFLSFNSEFSEKPLCTASIAFIKKKVDELKEKYTNPADFERFYQKIVEKACLCEGLTVSALKINKIEIKKISKASAVCPGPNLAYFSKISGLKEMIDHIYGRINLISDKKRPNVFVKELSLYMDYLQDKIAENSLGVSNQSEVFFKTFRSNLMDGIEYYKSIIPEIIEESEQTRKKIKDDLAALENRLRSLQFAPA